MTSYSMAGGGGQTVAPGPTANCSAVPNTPDVINSIISLKMNPFDHHYIVGGGSPASEESSSCSASCSPVSPSRVSNNCANRSVKEDLKKAIHSRSKQRNSMAAAGAGHSPVAATATIGSAASSPGGGQAKNRRIDEDSMHDGDDDDDYDDGEVSSHGEGLTAEDEERRRRRRERNKIAATKCRLKKREKTTNLMQESTVLESKNYDLKTQIQELEKQRNELMKMLKVHSCTKRQPLQHQQQHQQQLQQQLQQQQHHQQQHQQQQHQMRQQQQHREQRYGSEVPYVNDPYVGGQHHHVAAEPPILKDPMFNGGGYVPVASMANLQPTATGYHQHHQNQHHRPVTTTTTAVSVADTHYPVVNTGGSSGTVYASCVQDGLYHGYNKDSIVDVAGPLPDLSHQYYDQSTPRIC